MSEDYKMILNPSGEVRLNFPKMASWLQQRVVSSHKVVLLRRQMGSCADVGFLTTSWGYIHAEFGVNWVMSA